MADAFRRLALVSAVAAPAAVDTRALLTALTAGCALATVALWRWGW
ncbi:hypothetical protein [Actinoplanes rectilineatus]|nr:hypothetical protein [Actinoplanes rectilineatus]